MFPKSRLNAVSVNYCSVGQDFPGTNLSLLPGSSGKMGSMFLCGDSHDASSPDRRPVFGPWRRRGMAPSSADFPTSAHVFPTLVLVLPALSERNSALVSAFLPRRRWRSRFPLAHRSLQRHRTRWNLCTCVQLWGSHSGGCREGSSNSEIPSCSFPVTSISTPKRKLFCLYLFEMDLMEKEARETKIFSLLVQSPKVHSSWDGASLKETKSLELHVEVPMWVVGSSGSGAGICCFPGQLAGSWTQGEELGLQPALLTGILGPRQ